MPKVMLPIPESYVTITRPVVLEVVRNIRDITGIADDRFRISYQGYPEQTHLFGSSLGTPADPSDTAFFKELGKVSVRVNEQYMEDYIQTNRPHYADELAVFLDPVLNIQMKPVRHFSEIQIDFKYRAESIQAAKAWTDMIRYQLSEQRVEHVHDIPYEFGIPEAFIMILGELHRLRESQGGYGEDFGQWFNNHVSGKITTLTSLDGSATHLVFKETQKNVYGWFDFTTPPVAEPGESGSTFVATVTYTFRYEKPTAIAFYYPNVVHNQLLPKKYRGDQTDTMYSRMVGGMSYQNQRYDLFRKEQNHWVEQFEGIRIPTFDDWLPSWLPNAFANLMLVMCQIRPNDLRYIGSVLNIPGYGIAEPWLSFMKAIPERNLHLSASPFTILVFQDNELLDPHSLSIDEDLVITTNFDMDIRKTYHVMLGIVVDLSLLSEEATLRLINQPNVCIPLMKALDPTLESRGLIPKVIGNRKVVEHDYHEAVRQMITTGRRPYMNQVKIMANVGMFCVVAHRNER